MIGQTVSHYRIVAKLGGGGMGIVYKAEEGKRDSDFLFGRGATQRATGGSRAVDEPRGSSR